MHVVGHIHLGPAWKHGVPVTQQGMAMEQHLSYMRDLYERGKLILGGPYDSDDGGIAVFVTESYDEAQRLADADPASRAGVIEYELKAVRTVYDTATGINRYESVSSLMGSAARSGDHPTTEAAQEPEATSRQ